jgi:hypothetical protein
MHIPQTCMVKSSRDAFGIVVFIEPNGSLTANQGNLGWL